MELIFGVDTLFFQTLGNIQDSQHFQLHDFFFILRTCIDIYEFTVASRYLFQATYNYSLLTLGCT